MQTWGAELSHTHKSVAGRPAGAGIFASLAVRPRGASGKVDGLVDRVELRLTLERLGARSIEPPASILFLGQAPEGNSEHFGVDAEMFGIACTKVREMGRGISTNPIRAASRVCGKPGDELLKGGGRGGQG